MPQWEVDCGCIPIGVFLREKSPSTDPTGEFSQSMFLQRSDPLNTCKNTRVKILKSTLFVKEHKMDPRFFLLACVLTGAVSDPAPVSMPRLLQQADQYEPRKRRRTQSVSKTWLYAQTGTPKI
jgi:hypothetical protein